MGKFLTDFKEFAMKGNIIDMAVGVIIGGAFGKIVTSLVNDMIMPVISLLTGGDGYKNLKYVITKASEDGSVQEVAINYGIFIQNIIDFIIIALSIFVALRVIMKLKKKKEEEAAPAPAAPAPSAEETLLTEIRDLLKKEAESKK